MSIMDRKLLFAVLAIALMLSGCGLLFPSSRGTVDTGIYNSIGLDSNGKVFISFNTTVGADDSLDIATNTSGSWEITSIDPDCYSSATPSMVIDSSNNIHIIYPDSESGVAYLKYATNTSGSWQITTISSSESSFGFAPVAIDSAGKLHICYIVRYSSSTGPLKYLTNASGAWSETTLVDFLTTDSIYSSYSSIALDQSDKVHISYYIGGDHNSLRYLTNRSGTWLDTTISSYSGDRYSTIVSAITVDNNGNAHICYSYRSKVMYSTNASGSWESTQLAYPASISQIQPIAVVGSGEVHIAAQDTSDHLIYITNKSGSFETTTLDTETDVGEYAAIAIDGSNNVHIAYYKMEYDDVIDERHYQGDLKYATNSSGSWSTQVIYTAE